MFHGLNIGANFTITRLNFIMGEDPERSEIVFVKKNMCILFIFTLIKNNLNCEIKMAFLIKI